MRTRGKSMNNGELRQLASSMFPPEKRNGFAVTDLSTNELAIAVGSGVFPKTCAKYPYGKFPQGTPTEGSPQGKGMPAPVPAILKPAVPAPVPALAQETPQEEVPTMQENDTCPECRMGKLVKRTAHKGRYRGRSFLGCSAYPRCKYVYSLPVEGYIPPEVQEAVQELDDIEKEEEEKYYCYQCSRREYVNNPDGKTGHCLYCKATGYNSNSGVSFEDKKELEETKTMPTNNTPYVPVPVSNIQTGAKLPVVKKTAGSVSPDDAAALLTALQNVMQKSKAALDEDAVREIVSEMLDGLKLDTDPELIDAIITERLKSEPPMRVQVGNMPAMETKGNHELLPVLLSVCATTICGRNGKRVHIPTMMVGPAGSGKTTACEVVSEQMNLPYYMIPVNEETGSHDLIGYKDIHNAYVPTPLRCAYETGGVFVLDEVDKGRPGVMATLNALLAGTSCTFPDGINVSRHEDFVPVATANTWGNGASVEYQGSNALDGATRDRFFMLHWGYSKHLQGAIAGVAKPQVKVDLGHSGYTPESWLSKVETMQDTIAKKSLKHVLSPRAAMYGAALLHLPRTLLEEGLLFKGMSDTMRRQIGEG